MNKFFYLLALIFFVSASGFGQNMENIENELNIYITGIDRFSSYRNGDENSADSLWRFDNCLRNKLTAYSAQYPSLLSYDFKMFGSDTSGLTILTSEDKLFRIYSWDTQNGGTMHFYNNVYQCKTGDGAKGYSSPDTNDDGNPDRWYRKLYTIKAGKKNYYLATYFGQVSGKDMFEGVKLFSIENGTMNDSVKLIKTKSGLHNGISLSYNRFAAELDYSKYTTHFDNETNTIYIPVVLEDGKMTTDFIKYKFTGKYFEKVN